MRAAVARLVHGRPLVIAAGVMAVHLVVLGLAFDRGPHGGGDNAAYLSLARALLDHGRYVELWDPARPPHTQYPPGFPIILAVAWAVGLRTWLALKLMMLGFSTAAVGLSYLWMRERVGAAVALGAAGLLALAPGLANEVRWVLSDVPFWAATMGALLALQTGRDGWGIGLAITAFFIRSAGLPLLLAMAIWYGLRRRWKPALGVVLALAAYQIVTAIRTPSPEASYLAEFWLENPYIPEGATIGILGLLGRMVQNGARYGFEILIRTLTGASGVASAAVGGALVSSALVGFGLRVRRTARGWGESPPSPESGEPSAAGDGDPGLPPDRVPGLIELFAVLYAGMLLVWPVQWASDRFLIPLVPVLLVYAAEGARVLPWPRWVRVIRVGGAVVLLALMAPSSIALWQGAAECRDRIREAGPWACEPSSAQAFIELAQWTRSRLPEDAVIISRKPRLWYWYAGYPGRVYPFSRDPDALLEEAREIGARYVVLDQLGGSYQAYLLPALAVHRYRFCVVQRVRTGRATASLLGILPTAWDPEDFGLDEEDPGELRVPVCPEAYRRPGG